MLLYIKSRSITEEEKQSRGIDQKFIQLVFKREKKFSVWDPYESLIHKIVVNMQQTILWNTTAKQIDTAVTN